MDLIVVVLVGPNSAEIPLRGDSELMHKLGQFTSDSGL